jgi:hypothetical protein
MSTLLPLAADYIERMANPVFGIATNEDYAIKFGKLLESEDFEARLREEIETLRDTDVLSSHGWLWLFDWAKSTSVDLDQELLLRLFHEWASPFVRAEIVQLATRGFQGVTGVNDRTNVFDFPNGFLARIMIDVIRPGEGNNLERERSWGTRAQSVLVAFLQAGSPIALDAASALLRHRWEGQRELLDFFWVLHDSLDPETQGAWFDRLNPPRRFDGES